jgi:hypothetical protein
MRQIIILLTMLVVTCFHSATAQNIAINQDGSQPDTSAMLDISSTNKGLLAPRLTTTQRGTVALPATGLLLFNSTDNAFQYNSGTPASPSWSTIASTSKERSNHVLVKSAADFPAPVDGVITLVPTTVYEINGTIVLTSKINLNGSLITGMDAVNDKLVYTPSTGELFTGSGAGNLRLVTLTASAAGAKLFNVDGGNANKNFIVQNCYILGCNNIGVIKGFAGTVFFQTVAFFYNTNGITFENLNNLLLSNMLWSQTNSNTFETYTGTFNVIQKIAGAMQPMAASSGTAINVSGVTSIASGEIKVVFFTGNGTYISGAFSKQWEVESTGLSTEKDDVASGNLYLTTPVTTTFSGANQPVKVEATTTAVGLFRVTSPVSNQLRYEGTKTRRFTVTASLSATATSANKYYSFYIYKNGVKMPESEQAMRLSTGVDKGSLTLSCTVELANNDYIEVWAANTSDASSITVETLNLAIK